MCKDATLLAIKRASEHGVCVMGLRRSHHVGRLGTYGEFIAKARHFRAFPPGCSRELFGSFSVRFCSFSLVIWQAGMVGIICANVYGPCLSDLLRTST
jgi:hypothetical protein